LTSGVSTSRRLNAAHGTVARLQEQLKRAAADLKDFATSAYAALPQADDNQDQ
jgi:hypothetical protein